MTAKRRCKATTKDGDRCKNSTWKQTDYCYTHRDLAAKQGQEIDATPWERLQGWWEATLRRYWLVAILLALLAFAFSAAGTYNALTGEPALDLVLNLIPSPAPTTFTTPAASTAEPDEKTASEPTPTIVTTAGPGQVEQDPTAGPEPTAGPDPEVQRTEAQTSQSMIAFAAFDLAGDEGASVEEVIGGSAAEEAGLQQGDVILAADGEQFSVLRGLGEAIQEHQIGDEMSLTVRRGGQELSVVAVLGKGESGPLLGVRYRMIRLGQDKAYAVDAQGSTLYELNEEIRGGAWSPDGSRVVFRRESNLALLDAITGAVTNLTDDSANYYSPSWAPDGQRLAFVSDRDGAAYGLYVMDADGENLQRVAGPALSSFQSSPTWSPGGDRIAINCPVEGGGALAGLCIVDVSSGQTRVWTPGEAGAVRYSGLPTHEESLMEPGVSIDAILDPEWSPAENLVAFVGLDSGGSYGGAAPYSFVLNLETDSVMQLTGKLYNVDDLEWSPDGSSIAFLGTTIGADSERVFTIGQDASSLQMLTPELNTGFGLASYCCLDWMRASPPTSIISDALEIEPLSLYSGATGGRPSVWYDSSGRRVVIEFQSLADFQRALSGAAEPIVDVYETSLIEYLGEAGMAGSRGQTEGTASGIRFSYSHDGGWSSSTGEYPGFNLKFRALTASGRTEDYWLDVDPSKGNVQVMAPLSVKSAEGVYRLSLP